ncbi:DASH complex subunit ask1 [Coemansia spiralis]|uniref:DASH complex subunit ASK1 n=2 Tax=Coemansia TaxID=4863 RepID=A0A9W8FZL1_9FUNG|nr:hypothetical protein BX070DRAFT_217857 [Coemansia spiralis]KAJ1990814.1 DASH complex subunit ask1 [Coemansia umbellata]KAJ2622600.1 DASH complex subunit ask1 [Coemansia sp. RSA 1358]KAJ2672929.1 DASH complex subunit ask1 [Coemansia spiralis]
MAHYGRQLHQQHQKQQLVSRPDSRASVASNNSAIGGGRFSQALSAAVKREEYSRPPLPPMAIQVQNYSPEEQLEEIEQKITLTLQAIDANFDHCQRTMARDVVPKIEKLAKLSSDLLQASQPWLQFFMAVAASDEHVDDENDAHAADETIGAYAHGAGSGVLDDEDTRHVPLGLAQRAAIEEQAYKGDITARFPSESKNGISANDDGDTESVVDIDAEIATPQLTSRFMTQELRIGSSKKSGVRANGNQDSDVPPSTPRARNLKRMADYLSVSAKKRKLGTPAKEARREGGAPKTPLAMMHALVNSKPSTALVNFGGIPGSALSYASKNSSSIGTEDLMPETSPPHTTTFNLPQSRRIAPARGIGKGSAAKGKCTASKPELGVTTGPEEEDDEILEEINNLISRYDSPSHRAAPSSAKTSRDGMSTKGKQPASVARSDVPSSIGDRMSESEMAALANKYASPAAAPGSEDLARVRTLVADMEELLDEVEAMETDNAGQAESNAELGLALNSGKAPSNNPNEAEDGQDGQDDFDDDIPSPPQISSDLERSHVVVTDIASNRSTRNTNNAIRNNISDIAPAQAIPAGAPKAAANQPRRTFGAGRTMIRMDVEEMDNENMTIGHMSPLAIRSRQTMLARNQGNNVADRLSSIQPTLSVASSTGPNSGSDGPRFYALDPSGGVDEDDPFGPTPQRTNSHPVGHGSVPGMDSFQHMTEPLTIQSDRPTVGAVNAAYPPSTRSWSTRIANQQNAPVGSTSHTSRSNTVLGSDATVTFDSPDIDLGADDREIHTGDSRLNESSLTIDHNDYESLGQASIDGTTTILPTREMLQRAAQVAESSVAHQSEQHSAISEEDDDEDVEEDMTRNSAISATATSLVGAGELAEYSVDLFPAAFQNPPASLQLRQLYDLVRSQDQHIWSLDDLVTAAESTGGELQSANSNVFLVLLDLLSRRRLIRKVSDNLWSAH